MAHNHIQSWRSTKTFIPQPSSESTQWQARNCAAIIVLNDSFTPGEQCLWQQLTEAFGYDWTER